MDKNKYTQTSKAGKIFGPLLGIKDSTMQKYGLFQKEIKPSVEEPTILSDAPLAASPNPSNVKEIENEENDDMKTLKTLLNQADKGNATVDRISVKTNKVIKKTGKIFLIIGLVLFLFAAVFGRLLDTLIKNVSGSDKFNQKMYEYLEERVSEEDIDKLIKEVE